MADLILALDQGTTSSRAVIIEAQKGTILAIHGVAFKQHYPAKGWVAHDLGEIWASTQTAITKALAALPSPYSPKDIKAIGITNQRETTCLFDPKTGEGLAPAIVWQCKRSLSICQRWQQQGLGPLIKSRTGLRLDPYFSASKIAWWCEQQPELAAAIASGKAVVGTVDTYLLHRLTGSYRTEPSNASRTLLYNLRSGDFDQELVAALGLPRTMRLPEVVASDSLFGHSQGLSEAGLPDGIPVTGILGDQQAALLGQGCVRPGEGKCTYGTGAFLLVNIGESLPEALPENLLTTAFLRTQDKNLFALEGAAFVAGAAVDYLTATLGWADSPAAASAVLGKIRAEGAAPEVFFVPALAGLGSPHWQPEAQGAFFGLTRDTTKEQLIAATLEGIAFTVDDMLREMTAIQPLTTLKVDGGLSQSLPLMQYQADLAGVPVAISPSPEATAIGAGAIAAIGAGLGAGEGLAGVWPQSATTLMPHKESAGARQTSEANKGSEAARKSWQAAVAAVKTFAEQRSATVS